MEITSLITVISKIIVLLVLDYLSYHCWFYYFISTHNSLFQCTLFVIIFFCNRVYLKNIAISCYEERTEGRERENKWVRGFNFFPRSRNSSMHQ